MPRIYVEFSGLSQIGSRCKSAASRVDSIRSDFQHTVGQLDWDIRFESNINSTAAQLAGKLEKCSSALKAYQQFIEDTHDQYVKLDEYKKLNLSELISPVPFDPDRFAVVGPGGQADQDKYVSDVVNDAGDQAWIDAIKALMKTHDKLGDNEEAGVLEDVISYLEDFKAFFSGDKKGLSGASDLCSLSKSSIDVWEGLYDYFSDMYKGTKTGFFGEIAQKKLKILGVSSSLLGLASSILSASDGLDHKKWQSAVADYVDCGKDILSVINSGYELKHIGDAKSLADIKAGLWSPLSLYTAVGEAGLNAISQGFRSYEKYYADGKWDIGDTGAAGIDISMAGIYGLSHSLTFGLDDQIFGVIDRVTGGNGNSDMSYFEKAAEGYKILAENCGEAIGKWWANLTT